MAHVQVEEDDDEAGVREDVGEPRSTVHGSRTLHASTVPSVSVAPSTLIPAPAPMPRLKRARREFVDIPLPSMSDFEVGLDSEAPRPLPPHNPLAAAEGGGRLSTREREEPNVEDSRSKAPLVFEESAAPVWADSLAPPGHRRRVGEDESAGDAGSLSLRAPRSAREETGRSPRASSARPIAASLDEAERAVPRPRPVPPSSALEMPEDEIPDLDQIAVDLPAVPASEPRLRWRQTLVGDWVASELTGPHAGTDRNPEADDV